MIPRKVFTGFAKFQGIVSVNDFRLPIRAPGTFASFSGFLVKFLFCTGRIVTTELPSLVPPQRIDDYVEIHILH